MANRATPTLPSISTIPVPGLGARAPSPLMKSYSDPVRTPLSGVPPPLLRKSSGSIIISRDSPVEMANEVYEEGDARAMSPRRSSDEIERMGDDARRAMEEQARVLQKSLSEIVERVESVKTEHERLEGGCRFLESYIGELMQTSKITSSGAAGSGSSGASKARGRTGKK